MNQIKVNVIKSQLRALLTVTKTPESSPSVHHVDLKEHKTIEKMKKKTKGWQRQWQRGDCTGWQDEEKKMMKKEEIREKTGNKYNESNES